MEENSTINLITKQLSSNTKTNSTTNNQNEDGNISPIQINKTKLSKDSSNDMEVIINEIFKRTEKKEKENEITNNKNENLKNEKMNGLGLEQISENSENYSSSTEKREPIKQIKSQMFPSFIGKFKDKKISKNSISKGHERKSMALNLINKSKSKRLSVRFSATSSCYRNSINLDSPSSSNESPRKKQNKKYLKINPKVRISEHSSNYLSSSKNNVSEESSFKLGLLNFRKMDVYRQKFNNQLRINRQNVLKISIVKYMKSKFLFKDSKILIFNIKILYSFVILFSVISIICSCLDGKLYFKNTINYIYDKNINYSNLNSYSILKKRIITKKENIYRILNGISSILCCLLFIIIHYQTVKFVKTKKKSNNTDKLNAHLKESQLINEIVKINKKGIKKQRSNLFNSSKIGAMFDENEGIVKRSISLSSTRIELLIFCIINIIFYPPYTNKIFISNYDEKIVVYPINEIFILISFLKIVNIYRALIFISPINDIVNKHICKTNLISLNYIYIIKIYLHHYPIIFISINTIIIIIIFSSMIYYIEYFSINNVLENFDNKNETIITNFLNALYLVSFSTKKTVFGDIQIKTILGKIICIFGEFIGSFLFFFFFYYINLITKFKPEEQRAFSKLQKLFDPNNQEYKASNLIGSFLKLKRIYIEKKAVTQRYLQKLYPKNEYEKLMENKFFMELANEDYININRLIMFNKMKKKREVNEKIIESKKSSFSDLSSDEKIEDVRKKFIYNIQHFFILKIMFILDLKYFSDKFKIAKNFSFELNDAIYNLENKMDENNEKLSSRLDSIIDLDDYISDIQYNQKKMLEKFKRFKVFNSNILRYLIAVNNKYVNRRSTSKKLKRFAK